jgi:hypothetical protein
MRLSFRGKVWLGLFVACLALWALAGYLILGVP